MRSTLGDSSSEEESAGGSSMVRRALKISLSRGHSALLGRSKGTVKKALKETLARIREGNDQHEL